MFKDKPKVRAEEMWMASPYTMREFPHTQEPRAKVVKAGAIKDKGQGVEFYFNDTPNTQFFMPTEEFLKKFRKIY